MTDTLPAGSLAVLDSQNRLGYLFPDGSHVFPGLNFKYRTFTLSAHGWFIAQKSDNSYMFVNARNQEIVPGVSVTSLAKTEHKGLYKAAGIDRITKTNFSFYINSKGKAYYSRKPGYEK
jgi:hypothetical protein